MSMEVAVFIGGNLFKTTKLNLCNDSAETDFWSKRFAKI